MFPYENSAVCELIRGAVIWIIWRERNILIFEEGNYKSIKTLGNSIISLAKY
jgi:hypothetical protein